MLPAELQAGPKLAVERARVLAGCYPNGRPNDPKIYAEAVSAVLSQYPAEVIERVTNPLTGLPRTAKFMPSVAEIVEACNFEMRPYYQAISDQRQVEQRALLEAPRDPEIKSRFQNLVSSIVEYCKGPDKLVGRKALSPEQAAYNQLRTEKNAKVFEEVSSRPKIPVRVQGSTQ